MNKQRTIAGPGKICYNTRSKSALKRREKLMKIRFLGTGAADWREPVNGEFRALSSTLFDEKLLIDGTMMVRDRITHPEKITDMLLTHPHSDHFDLELIRSLAPIRVHAHSSWADRISGEGVEVVPFEYFESFQAAGYTVLPMEANHLPEPKDEGAVHFVLQDGEKTVLYATDGAWLLTREWYALTKFSLDAAIFDATIGEGYPGDYRIFEHNSIEMLRIMLRTMRQPMFAKHNASGHIHPVLKAGAPVYLTHMARTLHGPQGEVDASLRPEFCPAHDGMEVTV